MAAATLGTAFTGCKDYDDDVSNLQEQIDALNSSFTAALNEKVNALNAQVTALNNAKTTLENQIATLVASGTKSAEEIAVLKGQVAALQTASADAVAQIAALKTAQAEFETKFDALVASAATKEELNALKVEMDAANASFLVQMAALSGQISALETIVGANFELLNTKIATEIAALDAKIKAEYATKVELAAEVGAINGELAVQLAAIQALQDIVGQLPEGWDSVVAKLQETIAKVNQNTASITALNADVTAIKNDITEITKDIAKIETEILSINESLFVLATSVRSVVFKPQFISKSYGAIAYMPSIMHSQSDRGYDEHREDKDHHGSSLLDGYATMKFRLNPNTAVGTKVSVLGFDALTATVTKSGKQISTTQRNAAVVNGELSVDVRMKNLVEKNSDELDMLSVKVKNTGKIQDVVQSEYFAVQRMRIDQDDIKLVEEGSHRKTPLANSPRKADCEWYQHLKVNVKVPSQNNGVPVTSIDLAKYVESYVEGVHYGTICEHDGRDKCGSSCNYDDNSGKGFDLEEIGFAGELQWKYTLVGFDKYHCEDGHRQDGHDKDDHTKKYYWIENGQLKFDTSHSMKYIGMKPIVKVELLAKDADKHDDCTVLATGLLKLEIDSKGCLEVNAGTLPLFTQDCDGQGWICATNNSTIVANILAKTSRTATTFYNDYLNTKDDAEYPRLNVYRKNGSKWDNVTNEKEIEFKLAYDSHKKHLEFLYKIDDCANAGQYKIEYKVETEDNTGIEYRSVEVEYLLEVKAPVVSMGRFDVKWNEDLLEIMPVVQKANGHKDCSSTYKVFLCEAFTTNSKGEYLLNGLSTSCMDDYFETISFKVADSKLHGNHVTIGKEGSKNYIQMNNSHPCFNTPININVYGKRCNDKEVLIETFQISFVKALEVDGKNYTISITDFHGEQTLDMSAALHLNIVDFDNCKFVENMIVSETNRLTAECFGIPMHEEEIHRHDQHCDDVHNCKIKSHKHDQHVLSVVFGPQIKCNLVMQGANIVVDNTLTPEKGHSLPASAKCEITQVTERRNGKDVLTNKLVYKNDGIELVKEWKVFVPYHFNYKWGKHEGYVTIVIKPRK